MSFNKAEQLWNEEHFSMEKDRGIGPVIPLTRLMILYQPSYAYMVNINSDWRRVSVKRWTFSLPFKRSDKRKRTLVI